MHAQAQSTQSADSAPPGYDALYEQATNECATGNYAEARRLFAQAHELYPNAHTLRGLGLSELELGDHARAQRLLERALQSNVQPLSPALRVQTEQLLARARTAQVAPPQPASLEHAPRVIMPAQPEPPQAAPLPPAPPSGQPLPAQAGPGAAHPRTAVAGAVYVSAIVPFKGYAQKTQGVGLDGAVWIQLDHLVLEPRIGIRVDAADDRRGYFHIPMELGSYFMAEVGEHALFAGPGLGLHAIFESVDVKHTVGTAIPATSHDTIEDNAFGFGTFVRAGAVLLRTRVASLVPCVDYAITFADFRHGSYEHALRINVGVLMGGGR